MHPTRANILICQDEETVAAEAAGRFACAALSSVAQRDRFYVAVPGGWSPRGMYEMLTAGEFRPIVPWARTHLFFTDERCVPPDSEESNYRLVNDLLVSPVGMPDMNVHRFEGELDSDTAAARYEDELRRAMGESPRFDLVVLGMGRDTHTASLFPHSPALEERRRLAVAHYISKLDKYRLTLTLPVLCGARSVMILALGYEKAAPLQRVLQGDHDPDAHPVQAVQPTNGRLVWIVSADAASKL